MMGMLLRSGTLALNAISVRCGFGLRVLSGMRSLLVEEL